MEERRLLSVDQAARTLGVTPQHVRRLLRWGKLRGTRVGKTWTIFAEDLRDYQDFRMSGKLFVSGAPEAAPRR